MPAGVHILTGSTGERYAFDAGTLSLELLLTGGPGRYQRWEILHEPADLAGWLAGSRLALIAPLTAADVRVGAAELVAVKRLRDTLWTIGAALAHDRPLRTADLQVINEYAEAPPRLLVDPTTRAPRWATPITGAQVLGAVARDAIDVITRHAARVRECAADDCYLLFLDTSRPGNRRWCSMERCGNRHKVRVHRARALAGGTP